MARARSVRASACWAVGGRSRRARSADLARGVHWRGHLPLRRHWPRDRCASPRSEAPKYLGIGGTNPTPLAGSSRPLDAARRRSGFAPAGPRQSDRYRACLSIFKERGRAQAWMWWDRAGSARRTRRRSRARRELAALQPAAAEVSHSPRGRPEETPGPCSVALRLIELACPFPHAIALARVLRGAGRAPEAAPASSFVQGARGRRGER